jgi:hypothetical protein
VPERVDVKVSLIVPTLSVVSVVRSIDEVVWRTASVSPFWTDTAAVCQEPPFFRNSLVASPEMEAETNVPRHSVLKW